MTHPEAGTRPFASLCELELELRAAQISLTRAHAIAYEIDQAADRLDEGLESYVATVEAARSAIDLAMTYARSLRQ